MIKVVHIATQFLKQHSTAILSAGAIVGTATTAYLCGRASYNAALDIQKEFGPDVSNREKIEFVWKRYIPVGVAGVTTVACIVGSNRIGSRKVLAATMAYSLTEQAYSQYKEKVVEQLGENKERAIRDEIAKDNVLKNPPKPSLVMTGDGVLCCETYTMRYFMSDMETLRKSMNDLNAKLLHHDIANLDDFYYMIGLKPTQYSGDIGWRSSRLMELRFTTILAEDGRPCLAFEYNYVSPLD